jgi:hypothetical protein
MLPLLDLGEKVRNEAAKLPAFMGKLANSAGKAVKAGGERVWDLIPRAIRAKLPWLEGKPGFVLIGLGFALSVLLAALVTALVAGAGPPEGESRDSGDRGLTRDAPIPPEELFLPDEPDFLPGVIPERERRDLWTAEDAEPYWYNPLERGGEVWRNRIRTALDELLERVP